MPTKGGGTAYGQMEVVRLLIEKGADLNAQDDKGETPLMRASQGQAELARLLIEDGAQVNARDKKRKNGINESI